MVERTDGHYLRRFQAGGLNIIEKRIDYVIGSRNHSIATNTPDRDYVTAMLPRAPGEAPAPADRRHRARLARPHTATASSEL